MAKKRYCKRKKKHDVSNNYYFLFHLPLVLQSIFIFMQYILRKIASIMLDKYTIYLCGPSWFLLLE